jgi:hypothetical protein
MKISYAITVCNELEEIKRLLKHLLEFKRKEDEICVLLDKPKASQELVDLLYRYSSTDQITLKESAFQNHFADWKNELTRMCKGDFIFQIDADEYPHQELINHLPIILEVNDADVFLTPRINTVSGITQEHISNWRWHLNDKEWVNFPDYQWRIYKNIPSIRWINKVHEKLGGFKQFTYLPEVEEYCLYHPKDIERQERQNNYYDKIN